MKTWVIDINFVPYIDMKMVLVFYLPCLTSPSNLFLFISICTRTTHSFRIQNPKFYFSGKNNFPKIISFLMEIVSICNVKQGYDSYEYIWEGYELFNDFKLVVHYQLSNFQFNLRRCYITKIFSEILKTWVVDINFVPYIDLKMVLVLYLPCLTGPTNLFLFISICTRTTHSFKIQNPKFHFLGKNNFFVDGNSFNLQCSAGIWFLWVHLRRLWTF